MTGTIDHEAGGARWSLRPDLYERRADLFGPDGLRLAEWVAGGQATVLRQGTERSLYRIALPGLDFHLKRYPAGGVVSWLRHLVQPSKARVEFDHAHALAALRVPAVEALGIGETRYGMGANYLLTRTVPNTQTLSTFFETELPVLAPARQTRVRQRLARTLGRLLGTMHAVGAVNDDLHPTNILLRLVDDEPLLCLVDLLSVRLGSPLNATARFKSVLDFNRWVALRADRTDRLRFWRAYESYSPRLGGESAVIPPASRGLYELDRRALESNLRYWRKHDRRCLGDNRSFRRVRVGDVSGHAVADLPPDNLAALLADPDEPFRRPGVLVLKNSPSSTVVDLEMPGPDGPRRVIYKRFAVTTSSDPWAALFRPTPALRSYVMGHGLLARGLPTPRPLGVWHRRRFGLPREGYLLAEKVPDACDLQKFVAGLTSRPEAERRVVLRKLIDCVARLIRTLHERRLAHRDLKAPNLLVGENGAAVWFVDLVGVTRHRDLSRARRVKNLTRLGASFVDHPGVTRTDRLRFLRAYLAWGLHGKTGWKDWWRAIAHATRAKVESNRRRGRVWGNFV